MVCLMDTAMSVVTRNKIKADFNLTFKDAEKVSAQDIVDWALNTSEFYGHFFETRFKPRAEKAIQYGSFNKYNRTFRSMNGWAPYETNASLYNIFINYIVNSLAMRNVSYDDILVASNAIYDYYLKHFKELKDLA